MQVDFYQLAGSAARAGRSPSIAEKVLAGGGRLLIVGEDEASPRPARPDAVGHRADQASFRTRSPAAATTRASRCFSRRAPTRPTARATSLIADGEWRDAGADLRPRLLPLRRERRVEGARLAWKLLAGRDGVERRYWTQDEGRWKQPA